MDFNNFLENRALFHLDLCFVHTVRTTLNVVRSAYINCCMAALGFMSFCWYKCLKIRALLSLPSFGILCKGLLSGSSLLSCSSYLQKLSPWNVNNELELSFPSPFCLSNFHFQINGLD